MKEAADAMLFFLQLFTAFMALAVVWFLLTPLRMIYRENKLKRAIERQNKLAAESGKK